MRCKHCPYTEYDWGENAELCSMFGYGDDEITENRKGEEGCRFNRKTLYKMHKQHMQCLMEHPV